MFKLDHKIAAVTGAGNGIGLAIARALAGAGATVFILDRDAPAGESAARQIVADGGRAEFFTLDVADEQSCNASITHILSRAGRVDILVNNAGIGHVGTALTTTGDDLDRLYAVNVKGVLFMTRAVLPGMISRGSGSIIHVASIGGIVGLRDRLAYCATKFAVVGLAKCMALDHALTGVRINCICPGTVETEFVQKRIAEYPDPKKAYESMAARQAQNRLGRPEEIAAAALYLASDEAAFVTGSSLVIDGGLSAGK